MSRLNLVQHGHALTGTNSMGVFLWEQVFMTMLQSGVELTITTFGTLLIAGAEAHDYSLVQEASPAWLASINFTSVDTCLETCHMM